MKRLAFLLACALIGGCGDKDGSGPSTNAADNSARNKSDKDGGAPVPTDQKMNEADTKRTADIRKRVMDAKLSTNAENVKIITMNGRVTLRGPVKTQAEKDTIGGIALEIAGAANVDNQLEVETVR